MPATFSINVGTPTESYRKSDIYSVLQDIPDNTSKLITPKDVRDAVFSVWANSVFKQTTGTASIEYIGIDSNNPSQRDVKQKIFIGKRNVSGIDIMSNSLLSPSNDTDIFFFNTKSDTLTQSITKISILAGTNSALYHSAPYIKSEYISATAGDKISLDISNPSIYGGPVNVFSSTGRIAINNIIFPTIAESTASASNGKILRYSGTYPNGSLVWSNDTVSIANIGATGSPTNIFGSPVNINGFSLEFVDNTPIPQTVGSFSMGMTFGYNSYWNPITSTFSDWPLVKIIEGILYPYIAPLLSLSVINLITGTTYSEIGRTASIGISYSMTRYSDDITFSSIIGTTFSGVTFSSSPGGIFSGTESGYTFSSIPTSCNFVFKASDDPAMISINSSATSSINFVNPILYGYNMTLPDLSTIDSICSSLDREITPINGSCSINLNYNGNGYLYLVIPNSYPLPRYIKDPNGYIIHDYLNFSSSAFTYSLLNTYITPSGGGLSYSIFNKVWTTIATCSYPGGYFQFIF
jgi:hypothetical protein